MATLIQRIEEKVEVDENGCWIWTGGLGGGGYGYVWVDGKMRRVHIVVFELLVGPIPEGKELDHVYEWGCRSRACCNPEHLEPVTRAENNRRGRTGDAIAEAQRVKTHCPNGHPYSGDNLYVHGGKRFCRKCRLEASRRHRRR